MLALYTGNFFNILTSNSYIKSSKYEVLKAQDTFTQLSCKAILLIAYYNFTEVQEWRTVFAELFFFFSTLDQQHVKPHPQISKKITRLLLMGTWEKLRLFSPATVPHRIFLAKATTETHSPGKHTVASATRSSFLFLTSQLIQNTYSNFLNNWDESCKQQTLSLCCADSFQALFILQSEWGRVLWENKEWDHVIKDYLIMYTGIEL